MRKISFLEIAIFQLFFLLIISASILLTCFISQLFSFWPIFLFFLFCVFFVVTSIVCYWIVRIIFPIKIGEIERKSKNQRNYHIQTQFYLFIFHPIFRMNIIPIPFTRLAHKFLGAKIGENSYPGYSYLLDDQFVEVGDYVIFGNQVQIIPHIMLGDEIRHERIKIGHKVTLSVNCVIYGGAIIEDNALVLAGAVVNPGVVIGKSEIWGGTPAKFIKKREV